MRLILFVILFIASCSNEAENKRQVNRDRQPSVIRYHLLFSDFEKMLSFPHWFVDSLVAKQKISKISRSIYPSVLGDSLIDTAIHVPAVKWEYFFNRKGQLTHLVYTLFYDDRPINKYKVSYFGNADEMGYRSCKIDSLGLFLRDEGAVPVSSDYKGIFEVFLPKKYVGKSAIYKFQNSSHRLIFLNGIRNPLVIMRDIKPEGKDRLVQGKLPFPQSLYSLQDGVVKLNESRFIFSKEVPLKIVKNDFPFRNNRSFLYDLKGVCTGFVDSLYHDDEFLTRLKSRFYLNFFNAPNTIVHETESLGKQSGFTVQENFFYELYPQ